MKNSTIDEYQNAFSSDKIFNIYKTVSFDVFARVFYVILIYQPFLKY